MASIKNFIVVFLSPLLSIAGSGVVSYFVAVSTIAPSQDRQLRLEQVAAFSQGADDFLSLGARIVPKLNGAEPFSSEKIAIADASGRQAIKAQSLIDLFGTEIQPSAIAYQLALNQFVRATNSLNEPSQIRAWVEAFDGVVVAQKALKERMYSTLNVSLVVTSPSSL